MIIRITSFLWLVLFSVSCCLGQESFRVASYNIRYQAEADEQSGNGWEVRKGPLAALIKRHNFDLIATQEGNSQQLEELKKLLPGYAYLGRPDGGPEGTLHNCATFYKIASFEVLDSGVFWLSETPEISSIGWDASDRRICYWTKFKDRTTSKMFFVFNVHFYWRKHIAREKSGPLVVRKIKEIAGQQPIILMGDFNSTVETVQIKAIKESLSDAFEVTTTPVTGVKGTAFAGGVFQGEPKARIDYIFVSPHFIVKDYKVISDVYNVDHYPSDHLPVSSKVILTDN